MFENEHFPGFKGVHFDLPARHVLPRPIQSPHPPLWIAASNLGTYEYAAKQGVGIIGVTRNSIAETRSAIRTYRETIRAADPTGFVGKVAVMGLLERHGGDVRCKVIPSRRKETIQKAVREDVAQGSFLFTDALGSYEGMDEYIHQVVDHAERYVDGQVHTNGLENFWCLLKRCIKGTYVSVEPFHLFRYLDEQSFRFNNRKVTDQIRFLAVSRLIVGRRLTYKQLTGKDLA